MSRKKAWHRRLEELFEVLQEDVPEAEALTLSPEMVEGWRWQCDSQGRYVTCDESIVALLGYPLDEVVGQPLDLFALSSTSQTAVRTALAKGQFPAELEVQWIDAQDGLHPGLLYLVRRNEEGMYGFVRLQRGDGRETEVTSAPNLARQPWNETSVDALLGMRSEAGALRPAREPLTSIGERALARKTPIAASTEEGAVLAVPLETASQAALLEAIDPSPARAWSEDEQRLAEQVAEQLALALENAQLFQAAQRRAAELEALHQLTTAVSKSLDIGTIYGEALGQLQHLMAIDAGLVSQFDAESPDALRLVAHWNLPADFREKFESEGIPLATSPCGQTYRRGDIFEIPDLARSNDHLEIAGWVEAGFRSYVGAPVVYRGRHLGTLCLLRRAAGNITPREKRILRTVVAQLGAAAANAQLFQETQEALAITEHLYTAVAAFNQAATYEDIMRILHEHLGEKVHTVILSMFDQPWTESVTPEQIYPVAFWTDYNFPPGFLKQLASRGYPLSDFPTVSNIREGLFIPDTAQRTTWNEATRQLFADLLQAQAVAFVPLYIGGRWIGFLNVLYRETTVFTDKEQQFVRTLAGQAGVAVENLRSVESIQQHSKELETLYEATAAFNAASSYDEIMASFAKAAGDRVATSILVLFANPGRMGEKPPAWMRPAAYWTSLDVSEKSLQQLLSQRYATRDYPIAAQLQAPLYIPDAADPAAPWDENTRFIYHELLGARAATFMPLVVGDRWLGFVALLFDATQEFPFEERQRLVSLNAQVAVAVANLMAVEDIRRRTEEVENLYRVAAAFSAASSYEEVLDVLRHNTPLGEGMVDIVLSAFNRPWRQANDPPERAVVLARWTEMPEHVALFPNHYMIEEFPVDFRKIDDISSPVVVADVATDARLTEQGRAFYQAGPISKVTKVNSAAFFPLVAGGEVVGTITTLYRERRTFTEAEMRVLDGVIAQAAVTVQNLHRYEVAQEYASDLETAAVTASEIAAASQDIKVLLPKAVELIRERFGFYHASVFLADETGAYMVVRASTGKAGEEMLARSHRLGIGSRSTVGQAAATRQAVIINDTLRSDIHRPNPLLPDTRAEAAIPLLVGERLIGVLDVQSTQTEAFTPEAKRMLLLLASQLAVAIENAQAYELERQALEEMRRADELKTQFLANMSHELRTPLNSIIGFSRVILKGIDGPVTDLQQQDLTAIYNAGQHLLGLINDILDLSKIEAGKMELAFEEVNIADLVNSVMSTAVGLVKDKPVELRKEIQPDLPIIHADPIRVRQILLNLISNAAKFTEEGYIEVAARLAKGPHGLSEILVKVEDTGPGIAPEDQHKLFRPFSQVDASLTRKTGGTGLGLSITRNLVEMHGGRIWLESEVGKGATFYFTLPVIQPSQTGADESERIVLVVEDDTDVIHLYQRYLTPRGYRVIPLTEPNMAVARARELKPMAILLDIMMPERDGWQVLQELKKHSETRDIPVIVISIVEERERGFSLGAADYLHKPVLEEDLARALEKLDPDGRVKDVLVVEDDPSDLYLVTRLLNEIGPYTVRTAENGEEALKLIRKRQPDAVILDLLLPKLNGFAVVEEVRSRPEWQNLPIIIFTAADLSPAELAQLRAATQGLIQKGSLDTESLLEHLQRLLRTLEQGRSRMQDASTKEA